MWHSLFLRKPFDKATRCQARFLARLASMYLWIQTRCYKTQWDQSTTCSVAEPLTSIWLESSCQCPNISSQGSSWSILTLCHRLSLSKWSYRSLDRLSLLQVWSCYASFQEARLLQLSSLQSRTQLTRVLKRTGCSQSIPSRHGRFYLFSHFHNRERLTLASINRTQILRRAHLCLLCRV